MKVDAALSARDVDVREAAAAIETAGYDAAWVSEGAHDPLLALTLASVVTSQLELGTSIAVAFSRNPMTLATTANDLQLLSKGRLSLGLGSQVKAHITRRFSMPWSSPAPRMREFVLAMQAIWHAWETGEPLSFEGEFYSHTLMVPAFNPGANPHGRPRVLLAGVGNLMTAVAGEVADGFMTHPFTTERYVREITLPALAAGRAKVGATLADFEVSGSPMVAVGRDEREIALAVLPIKRQIAFYASTPAYKPVLDLHGWGDLADRLLPLSRKGKWDEMTAMVEDEVVAAFAVVGSPDDVAQELVRRYGNVMTRATLYAPTLDASLAAETAKAVRSLG